MRIAFLIAALNNLDILLADVQNAYLNAPIKEKVYTTAGLEFGAVNKGQFVLIVQALYGIKSSGARWRDHMAATLRNVSYVSSLADSDVLMKPQVKANGNEYWEYILCYVDDLLVIRHNPKQARAYLGSRYAPKEGSVKEPDASLGAEIKKWNLNNPDNCMKSRTAWTLH